MFHRLTLFVMGGLMLLSSLCTYAQEYQGTEAARLIPGSEWVRMNPINNALQFIKLAPETTVRVGEHENWIENILGFRGDDQLEMYREETDKLGYFHLYTTYAKELSEPLRHYNLSYSTTDGLAEAIVEYYLNQ